MATFNGIGSFDRVIFQSIIPEYNKHQTSINGNISALHESTSVLYRSFLIRCTGLCTVAAVSVMLKHNYRVHKNVLNGIVLCHAAGYSTV